MTSVEMSLMTETFNTPADILVPQAVTLQPWTPIEFDLNSSMDFDWMNTDMPMVDANQVLAPAEANRISSLMESDEFQNIMEAVPSPSNWIHGTIGNATFNEICSQVLLTPPGASLTSFDEVPSWILQEAFTQRQAFYYVFHSKTDEHGWRWDSMSWSQSGTWRKISDGQLERVSFSLKADRTIKRTATRRAGDRTSPIVVIYSFK